jgi:hypothetical protein
MSQLKENLGSLINPLIAVLWKLRPTRQRSCLGPHSLQGQRQDWDPGSLSPVPMPRKGKEQMQCGGARLPHAQVSGWAAVQLAPGALGSLWWEQMMPGTRRHLWQSLWTRTRDLCLQRLTLGPKGFCLQAPPPVQPLTRGPSQSSPGAGGRCRAPTAYGVPGWGPRSGVLANPAASWGWVTGNRAGGS